MKAALIILSPITIALALCVGIVVGLYLWVLLHFHIMAGES